MENADGPHAGDLPNMEASSDGTASYLATAARVTLGEGANSLFDSDGSALVIHAGEDDQRTDPSGESGDRIACGEIVSAGRPNTGGGGTTEDEPLQAGAAAALGAVALAAGLVMRRLAAREDSALGVAGAVSAPAQPEGREEDGTFCEIQ